MASASATAGVSAHHTTTIEVKGKRARPKVIASPEKDTRPALHDPIDDESGSDDFDIIVRVDDSIVATSSAQSGAAVLPLTSPPSPSAPYGRFGLGAGTYPGLLALNFQPVRFQIPQWVVGRTLDFGLGVEANHLQAGLGLTFGDKLQGEVGYHLEYKDARTGPHAGVVLRF